MPKSIEEIIDFVRELEEEISAGNTLSGTEAIQRICKYGGIIEGQIKGSRRTQDLADLRHAAFYLLRIQGLSLKEIGELFGRDHSTVIHGCKRIKNYMDIYQNRQLRLVVS